MGPVRTPGPEDLLDRGVTIRDVARFARVSTATVSRVLNGDARVRQETRVQVLSVIEKLDYKPNALARNLRRQASRLIVVTLPDISNPFFSRILKGMEDRAREHGYAVLVCNTDNRLDRELDYINLLRERVADGAIFTTARVDSRHIVSLGEQVPLVLACEYVEGLDIPSVSIDNVGGAFRATAHLLGLGHRRVGFINGPDGIILCRDRLKGYRLALRQAGTAADPALERVGTFHVDSGEQAGAELLALPDRPTAIFAANDEMAIGAIRAARAAGLAVPDDVAIVGFDDIAMASLVDPPLTTIAQPTYEIGTRAMSMLIAQLHGEPLPQRKVVLDDHLVVRGSCGAGAAPPRTAEPTGLARPDPPHRMTGGETG